MAPMEYSDYLCLEMELKRLRTFLKCTIGWSEYLLVNQEQLEDDNDDKVAAVSLGSLLCKIKDALIRYFGPIRHRENTSFGSRSCCFLLCGEIQKIFSCDAPKNWCNLESHCMPSRFGKNNEVLGQEINRAYITFSDCLSKLTSPMRDVNELMELIDTVLENLTGILNFCDADVDARFTMDAFHVRLQNLKMKLRFLKSFIYFAKFRVVE
ncbi:hypothetical protein ACH5RR_041805 [Cinchona calisaya]|uniref:Uncharacterized protein n=1 Tax=Cinchona calisaya TaxID=153742 RepID=A0ABD2XVU6_9GENT